MDLPRSLFYDAPVPITEGNLTLMRVLAEQYTATPFYGSGRMQVALQRAGYLVNRKHVQRLMRLMGLEAVGPKPRLSEAQPGHRVYPYLLRNVPIVRGGPGVEHRYHLGARAAWLRVPGGDPGLVQPVCVGLGTSR